MSSSSSLHLHIRSSQQQRHVGAVVSGEESDGLLLVLDVYTVYLRENKVHWNHWSLRNIAAMFWFLSSAQFFLSKIVIFKKCTGLKSVSGAS